MTVWLSCLLMLVGHNPDTSYARVSIDAGHVRVRVTFDIFTLLKIVPLDSDGDEQISREELERHSERIRHFIESHVHLDVGIEGEGLGEYRGFVWPAEAEEAIDSTEYHSAIGLIHFQFERAVSELPEDVAIQFNYFDQLGERLTVLGVFEVGDEQHEVTFSANEPDYTFQTGVSPPLFPRLVRFFWMGVEHILIGYDHICFLMALIVVGRFREIVKIVTSFTLAHSITLILAATETLSLPTRFVETSIALTIVYVAIENVVRKETRHRWLLTFFFGLVHGFGFANVLSETGLPTNGLVRCLVSFNLGVEAGQISIALLLLPLSYGLSRWKHGRSAIVAISLLLAAFGAAWAIDRLFGLEWMPF